MRSIVCACALALLLAACASPRATVDLAPQTQARLHTLAIVMPPRTHAYAVVDTANPLVALTLVGGIFVAAEQDRKEALFYQAMQSQKFSFEATLGAALESGLAAAGYRATPLEGVWENRGGRYFLRPELAGSVDAILVVVPLTTGFVAGGPMADYVPTVTVLARLLSPDGKTELYRAFHASGWQPRAQGWRFTPASKSFSGFDALVAAPAASAAALAEGAAAVSATIARDLSRP